MLAYAKIQDLHNRFYLKNHKIVTEGYEDFIYIYFEMH